MAQESPKRRADIWRLVLACMLGPHLAAAAQNDPRLPRLFEQLRAAPDMESATGVEDQIWTIWAQVDDAEGEALLEAGTTAMQRRAFGRALDSFNQLVGRDPAFAEGWNKRATLFYLMGDYERSVLDIEKTLALEPRHFGALSGLGLIYIAVDEPQAALRSFEAALAIHPKLASAKAHVDMLRAMIAGDPT